MDANRPGGRDLEITSTRNDRVKLAVRLRSRSHRDVERLLLVEGYRELFHALEAGWRPDTLFYARSLFLGANEDALLARARAQGTEVLSCTAEVFRRMAYRDRPDGLLAIGPQVRRSLQDLVLPPEPLLLLVEAIEKPGNLGTMLRSADAAGVDAVIVCDQCTDLNNPNVVRASVGTLFTVQTAEASSADTRAWLRGRRIRSLAATPEGKRMYTEEDLTGALALVVGSEQYGLSSHWMRNPQRQVAIPMRGRADSLNVAAAATILLFEAVRQRTAAGG